MLLTEEPSNTTYLHTSILERIRSLSTLFFCIGKKRCLLYSPKCSIGSAAMLLIYHLFNITIFVIQWYPIKNMLACSASLVVITLKNNLQIRQVATQISLIYPDRCTESPSAKPNSTSFHPQTTRKGGGEHSITVLLLIPLHQYFIVKIHG